MNCNTTHYRANSSSVPGDPRQGTRDKGQGTRGKGQVASSLLPLEKALIIDLEKYSSVVELACAEMNPSLIASYAFNLAKNFNSFYAEHSVAKAETPEKKVLRLQIAQLTAIALKDSMALLGIKLPERM